MGNITLTVGDNLKGKNFTWYPVLNPEDGSPLGYDSQTFSIITVEDEVIESVDWDVDLVGDIAFGSTKGRLNGKKPDMSNAWREIDANGRVNGIDDGATPPWVSLRVKCNWPTKINGCSMIVNAIVRLEGYDEDFEMGVVYDGGNKKPKPDVLNIDDFNPEEETDWQEKYEELLLEYTQLNRELEELRDEHEALKNKYEPKGIWGQINQWLNKKKWMFFAGILAAGFIIGIIL